ncbi:MAG: GntR family transcriptional regulator [Rhodospirillaceae bacterium]|nr:GntR family transcriptional regulator [Rhodospirillaceae bacterium]
MLEEISGENLCDRLRRGIEEDILAGRLAPGDRLDERSLAARYGVSRTPVREALLQLASLGIVALRPRHGATVAAVDVGTLVQMFDVMILLEAECARLAARRMSRGQHAALAEIQAKGQAAIARGDLAAFNAVNWSFHQAIFAGAQNAYLAEQARLLRLRLHPYRCYLMVATGRMGTAHGEHQRLVDAIGGGDERAAFDAMRGHLTIDPQRFSDFLAAMPARLAAAAPQRRSA